MLIISISHIGAQTHKTNRTLDCKRSCMESNSNQFVCTIKLLLLCNSLCSIRTEDATLSSKILYQHIALNSSCRNFNKPIVRCNRIATCQKGNCSQKKYI